MKKLAEDRSDDLLAPKICIVVFLNNIIVPFLQFWAEGAPNPQIFLLAIKEFFCLWSR